MAGGQQQYSEYERKGFEGDRAQQPAVGIPYAYPPAGYGQAGQPVMVPPYQHVPIQYFAHDNPYQAGAIPPNAIYDLPYGIPLRETAYRDTPAPFECPHCRRTGVTNVKSKPSLAACMACMISVVGVCFLCPGMDCLWHKEHFCPNCGQKVADFKKSDPCAVVDAAQWMQPSFAIPA